MSDILKLFVPYNVLNFTVCCIISILLFFVTVLYLLQPRSVTTFIEHVLGLKRTQRVKDPDKSDEDKSETQINRESKTSEEEVKKINEPVFNSDLLDLEEVIKETISEDVKSKNTQLVRNKASPKSSNIKKANKEVRKSNSSARKEDIIKLEKSAEKKTVSKPKTDLTSPETEDVVGYSFFPVKGRSKSIKKKNIQETKENGDTESKLKRTKYSPVVTEQFKSREQIQSFVFVPGPYKKSTTEKIQKVAPRGSSEENLQLKEQHKAEIKESKKVCPTISYASIVTNNIPETTSPNDKDLEEKVIEEQINTEVIHDKTFVLEPDLEDNFNSIVDSSNEEVRNLSNTNIFSDDVYDSITYKFDEPGTNGIDSEPKTSYFTPYNSSEVAKDFEDNSWFLEKLTQKTTAENLSKSNSSSIEVICDESSNTDAQIKDEDDIGNYDLKKTEEIQFDVIEKNLNKLVQSTTEIDQFTETICGSETSSIYIFENQTEKIESEADKEETDSFSLSGNIKFLEDCCTDSSSLDTFIVVDTNQEDSTESASELTIYKDSEDKAVELSYEETTSQKSHLETEDFCIFEQQAISSNSVAFVNIATTEEDKIEPEVPNSDDFGTSNENQETFLDNFDTSFSDQNLEPSDIQGIIEEIKQLEKAVVGITELVFKDQNDFRKIDDNSAGETSKFHELVKDETTDSVTKNTDSVNSNETYLEENEIKVEASCNGSSEEVREDETKQLIVEATETVNANLIVKETQQLVDEEEQVVASTASVLTDEPSSPEMASQIRVLTLNNQEHQECTLYRLEKNWVIQFRLGPSLFGRKVYLYCNYPVENKSSLVEFQRDRYQLLNWALDEGCKNADDTAAYTEIVVKLSGSFHYYFTFEKSDNAERQGSGFFLVDPVLKYGKNEDLPLDCIQCQTVLSKGLGSFSTWEKKLQVAKESGYNMIHFTPIQELGFSNSSYSLSEQLKLNPIFKKENGVMPTFEEIKKFTSKMRNEWKITSICDIVLNHTANESEWIKVHPEVTYNCVNCPYMRPAYLLDAAFHQFSIDVKKGLYEDKGIPVEVNNEEHLNAIRYHFRLAVLQPLKIEELYICDTSKLAAEFSKLARNTPPTARDYNDEKEELKIFQDKEYKRLASTTDMKLALKLYNVYRNDTFDEETRLKKCTEDFKNKLDSLNNAIIQDVNDHLIAATENVIAGIRYFRVQADGPRIKEITIKNPLVYRYFTDYGTPKNLKEHEEIMYSANGRFLMAHNGWVMNSDPLKNFANPDSNVYIRRELIAWGDSVKLRFGDEPKDCPFLWEHMRKYVEQTAEIFDGVRLDNCHSTPIPVAEYLLDCARRVRPDLYVVAELFTNSDMTDNIFVNRLGITSLVREAMSAWDSHEEGRLVYRYGGSPVGSFYQPRIRPLVPAIAHALFLDLTHDNPSPVEKRSVFDLLPSTALVNMACCASGSNRGYDELVPHHIHVVDEDRQYTEWTEDENLAIGNSRYVTRKSGIIAARKAINDIHFSLGKEGYGQVYVDQMDSDIVAVTRHRPDTHESYVLVAFTAFGHPNEDAANYQRGIRPLRFEGVLDEIVLEATLSHVSTKTGGSKFSRSKSFVKDAKWVNGLSEYQVTLKQHIQAKDSDIVEKVDSGSQNVTQLNFKNFKPGSVVIVKASLPETMREAVKTVRTIINQFSLTKETEVARIIDKLTLADLNRIIYRCGQEERDEGFGFDTYNIPNFGSLVYSGLQGFISLLANIRPNNDLGHPMCANLRDGNWMIEYIWKRLKLDIGTKELGQWIEENTKCFNDIPRYLVPSYFDVIITGIYTLVIEQSCKLMSNFVNHGSTFVRGLSLGSVQFSAYIKSADLPVLSPNLAPPKPPTRKNDKGESVQACVTLSAGLPHFSVGYMRNWGRDTFIALRGLYILTGRFEEARQHILGYGACLRHGLIPNLLDGGRNPRFNCRDAVWWWMNCIKEYVEEAPKGIDILSDKVSRIFPTDDSPAQAPGTVDQPLHDVMQEALKVHFQGLTFRERNAGRQIDEHMTDRGFNNQIGIHPETGFVFGGNEWNCGTWMDKMGSSDKAGNRGKPATPRDGSAVELIGLSKAVITWLWKLSQEKKYPYIGVERTHKSGNNTKWTFKEWSDKIQANFEKYFWVNNTPVAGEYRPDLINKRGIYKDCYGATQEWSDFQLRCNFPIAMVAAPELFTPQHAWIALQQAEKYLLGPLGMKTLDPEDWAYHGDYDNSNDSGDPSVAHGFNYHQGPEWVWPVGFFLRAKLHFASLNGALPETLADTKVILSKHFTELQTSVWRGLPELTNSNGSYCNDSSRTQAWSMSGILEVLHDLQKIEAKQPLLIN